MAPCPTLANIQAAITSFAALVGVYVAFAGLSAWQQQLRGRTEYDLARRLLRTVLAVRDQFSYVRHPIITGGEMIAARDSVAPAERDRPLTGNAAEVRNVYQVRWIGLEKAFSDLEVELLEGEVIWGAEVRTKAKALYTARGQLSGAIIQVLDAREHGRLATTEQQAPYKGAFDILYAKPVGADADAFAAFIAEAVAAFEGFLKPKLHLG